MRMQNILKEMYVIKNNFSLLLFIIIFVFVFAIGFFLHVHSYIFSLWQIMENVYKCTYEVMR